MSDTPQYHSTNAWSHSDFIAAKEYIAAHPHDSEEEIINKWRAMGLVTEGMPEDFLHDFIREQQGKSIDVPDQSTIGDVSKFDAQLKRFVTSQSKKYVPFETVLAGAKKLVEEWASNNGGQLPIQGPYLAKRVDDIYYRTSDKRNQQERLEEVSKGEGAKDDEFVRHPMNYQILPKNQHNIDVAMSKLRVTVRYNLFTEKMVISYRDKQGKVSECTYEDPQRQELWYDIDKEFNLQVPAEYFDGYIERLSRNKSFHPVREWQDSLIWDKEERITKWLISYAGVEDSEYARAISAIFLVAAVKRIFEPGVKYDEMLVLEGDQGVGKSSLIAALCHSEEWFSDDLPLNVDAKQIIERTVGKWLIEASELSGMHESKVEHLKSFLSRRVDGPTRMAYAHLPVEKPRQFVLIGTTNSEAYLDDSTGNRRFWPVKTGETGEIKLPELARDKDQLWAEAVAWYKGGASIRLEPNLYDDATKQQEARRALDPWEEILSEEYTDDYLRIPPSDPWKHLHVLPERQDRKAQKRVVAIMQRLKFQKMSVRHDGKAVHGWGRGSGLPLGDVDAS